MAVCQEKCYKEGAKKSRDFFTAYLLKLKIRNSIPEFFFQFQLFH